MKRRRLVVAAAFFACALAVTAGWFFQESGRPALPPGGWQAEFADGRTSVSVWQASGTAASAAAFATSTGSEKQKKFKWVITSTGFFFIICIFVV